MQTSPGQHIQTIAGHHYTADPTGLIEAVAPEDVSELLRVGCKIWHAPEPPAPPAAAEPGEIELPPNPTGFGVAVAEQPTAPPDPAAAGHHEAPEKSEQ
jgi:hypothetical protein